MIDVGSTRLMACLPYVSVLPGNYVPARSPASSGFGEFLRVHRRRAEGLARPPVDHEAEVYVMVREVHEVLLGEDRRELLRDDPRILGSESEGDERPHVPQDGGAYLRWELGEVLVRKHEPHSVFLQFRDHTGDRERRHGLELVDIQEEGLPLLLGRLGAGERGKRERRHEKRSQEGRAVFPEFAFGEVHEEDLPFVHDLPEGEVDFGFHEDAV